MRVACWWRVVVGSGLSCGCASWSVRGSVRSFSGSVVVVGFGEFELARSFAARWSRRLRLDLFLRCRGGRWWVSVPCER